MYEINFIAFGRSLRGKGWIFVNDTALICQGYIPKFELGIIGFIRQIYEKVLYISTIRTIPYATIVKYKKPSFFRKAHEITYRVPNIPGDGITVKFQMTKLKKRHDEIFTSRLEEYLAIAQSFVSS